MPRLALHLEKHAVVAELFATRWFVAIFANALPVETMLRVWDVFMLEGTKVLHRVALALLRVAEPRLLACADQQEALCVLQEEQGARVRTAEPPAPQPRAARTATPSRPHRNRRWAPTAAVAAALLLLSPPHCCCCRRRYSRRRLPCLTRLVSPPLIPHAERPGKCVCTPPPPSQPTA